MRDFLFEDVLPIGAVLLLIVGLTFGLMNLSARAATNSGHFIVVEHRTGGTDIVYDCRQVRWCDEHRIHVWTMDGRELVIAGSWSVEEIRAVERAPGE